MLSQVSLSLSLALSSPSLTFGLSPCILDTLPPLPLFLLLVASLSLGQICPDSDQRMSESICSSIPLQQATFAAGCFWSVELAFQRAPGVVKTVVGYTQGTTENPTYREVCGGKTNHAEAVLMEYDPEQSSYEKLLEVFWAKHDPTQVNGQGNDVGTQYRSGIYFHTQEQENLAWESLKKEEKRLGQKIATEILPAKEFYPAEDYHQQYLEKGSRYGLGQSAAKGCKDPIRCYG